MPRLSLPQIVGASSVVEIDAATRRSLEITQTLSGEKKGSLLHAIDKTSSAAGQDCYLPDYLHRLPTAPE